MALDQLSPATIAELRRPLARADDVREEHGCEHTVQLGVCRPLLGERDREALDLSTMVSLSPYHGQWGPPRKLLESCAGDLRRHPTRRGDGQVILAAVQHERRHPDRRQHVAHVDLRVHPGEHLDRARGLR